MQVPGKQGAMPTSVMTDEALLKVKPDKLRNLPPAFVPEGGTVTAGNSSIIADGAAALLLVSAERASELGLRVRHLSPHTVDCVQSVLSKLWGSVRAGSSGVIADGAAALVWMSAERASIYTYFADVLPVLICQQHLLHCIHNSHSNCSSQKLSLHESASMFAV